MKLHKKIRHVALHRRASPSLLSEDNQDTIVDETIEKAPHLPLLSMHSFTLS